MGSDDEFSPPIDRFSVLLNYPFAFEAYDYDSSTLVTENDQVLANEIKRFYPELRKWPDRCLSTAWRLYSKAVGLDGEEYVCMREPNFLSFLYANQEGWQVDEDRWVETFDRAAKELWQ
jgi:hypothetical protein